MIAGRNRKPGLQRLEGSNAHIYSCVIQFFCFLNLYTGHLLLVNLGNSPCPGKPNFTSNAWSNWQKRHQESSRSCVLFDRPCHMPREYPLSYIDKKWKIKKRQIANTFISWHQKLCSVQQQTANEQDPFYT